MGEQEIKLEIPFERDREKIISGLANSGYKVWIEIKECSNWEGGNIYYVVFDLIK